jgi:hypothetical protein
MSAVDFARNYALPGISTALLVQAGYFQGVKVCRKAGSNQVAVFPGFLLVPLSFDSKKDPQIIN